jgi:nitrogenase molybdenum-iron protein alpha chain
MLPLQGEYLRDINLLCCGRLTYIALSGRKNIVVTFNCRIKIDRYIMNLLKSKTAVIREKRLQTITAYYGQSDILLEEFTAGQLTQRVRTFSQDTLNDIMYSLKIIATIKNAAVVIHGASGCAVSRLTFHLKDENNGKWAMTNLNERDSIMGSDKKLYETVKQVYQLHYPEIIFIVSTPIVAINNEEIESVAKELEGE